MARLVNSGKNISLYTDMDSRAMKAETHTQIYTEIIRDIPRYADRHRYKHTTAEPMARLVNSGKNTSP